MSEREARLLEEVLSLPAEARAALVEQLLASFDASARQHIDTLWAREAEDRLDAFERSQPCPLQTCLMRYGSGLGDGGCLSRSSPGRICRRRHVLQYTA
jgi:Putative addiction module component